MLEGLLSALFIAWILSLFGFDDLFIRAIFEMFGKHITDATYYISFGVIGATLGLLERILDRTFLN